MKRILPYSLITLLLMTYMPIASADWWNDVKNNRVTSVTKAIAEGQDPNAFNQEGHTAIIYAAREQSKKSYMALVHNTKVDVNLANRYDETPLMYAAIMGDMDFAKALLNRGARVNKLGWTPLHYAAVKGKTEMVNYLLSQGALPNAPAPDGSSPLYSAVQFGSTATIKALLKGGADPYAINQAGKSAMDLAKEKKMSSVIKLFEQKH
ncbi:ankyrin repeat domain-containing protein [Pelistega ratti]|uniref:ankyrin repeat domain-containing protein n=1 Tax=Pelistega ratti TaxID=2652177 RepID=UPI0013592A2A|nr:ankyrin repeat domain-containing protein [Pelistega ratti]